MATDFRSSAPTRSRLAAALAALAALVLASAPLTSRADGVADEAEADFRMAVARFQANDYEGALAWFMASNRLAPNPNVQFNIARTFDALSRLPEAHRWYQDALASATTDTQRGEIRASLSRLEARVALVEVVTDPPGATIFLDRRDLGSIARSPARIAVAAGEHRILVSLEGHADPEPVTIQATVGQVASARVTLRRIVGQVIIEGDEGATIHVDRDDGDPACSMPCTLDLVPGVHSLRARRDGYRFDPVVVRIEPGVATNVRIEGRVRTGSLVVTADERDATVQIDGEHMGFTPAVLPNVAIGERRVRVMLDGYEPVEITATIVEGQQTDLRDLRLVPARVVTTVSRVAESYDDSPASLSVVTAQEFQAFHYPTIAEALRGLRGVSITNDSSYTSISVRGLGQPNDYGNRLLILQDGAVLNDNLLYQSYTGFDGRVDMGDVQRLEFVRGPGSVLYGTGAVSGLVNLLQHQADRPTSADVTVSTVSDQVGRGRGHLHIRLPGGGGLDASVSGAYGLGRSMTITPRDGSPDVNVSGVERMSAYGSVGRLAVGDFRLQWMMNHRSADIVAGVDGTDVGDRGTVYRDTRTMVEARYEPRLGEHARLFLRAVANDYQFRAGYVYDATPSRETYHGIWVVTEARVVLNPVDSLQLTFGSEVNANLRASMQGREVGDPDRYLDASNRYQIFAGYALGEWEATDWLRVSAGVRADVWRTQTAEFDPPFALSPRVATIFRVREGGVLKLMSGRAFRAPSTYELIYNDGGTSQEAAPTGSLRPETVWSAEAEYSQRFADDWVAIGSLYYQRARHFIELAETFPGSDVGVYARSSNRVRMIGGDVEIRREWRDGWMLTASYGYLDARYESLPDAAGTTSTRVPNQPRHYAAARTVVPFGHSGVSLAIRGALEGRRRIDLDDDTQTPLGVVVDTVLSGESWNDHLTWAFGVYDLFGWQRSLPVGGLAPARTFTQPGRSLFAEIRLSY
jgi:outer membrane receptor for ferrienterochelin and colicins